MSRAHVSADYYYRIPVRPIYKSYPVYAPGREPAGYEEWLKRQEPETVFEVSKLKTEADWIKAGEVVFDAPIFYDALVRAADVKDPLWHVKTGALAAKDGSLPYFRYGSAGLPGSPSKIAAKRIIPTIGRVTEIMGMSNIW